MLRLNTIVKIFKASPEDISEVIGTGNGERISIEMEKFRVKLYSGEIPEYVLMALSGVFEIGVGQKKLKLVIDKFGEGIYDIKQENLLEIEGIKEKTSIKIMRGLEKYKIFRAELLGDVEIRKPLPSEEGAPEICEMKSNKLSGLNIVVTGTRTLDGRIKARGGNSQNAVTKATNIVVLSGKSKFKETTKVKEARKRGIKIMEDDEFEEEYLS